MNGNISLLRAVAATFLRRLMKRIALVPLGLCVLLLVLIGYLGVEVHSAWWLALIILLPVVVMMVVVFVAAWIITGMISPRKLTHTEAKSIREFTDKVMATAETAQTPLPVLGMKLAKDIVLHRDPRLLREFIADSSALKNEYQQLKITVNQEKLS